MSAALSKVLTVVLTRALGLLVPAAETVAGFISFDQFSKTVAKYLALGSTAGGLVGFLTYLMTNSGAYTTNSVAAMVVATGIGALIELVKKFRAGGDPSNPPEPSPAPSPVKPGSAPKFLSTFEHLPPPFDAPRALTSKEATELLAMTAGSGSVGIYSPPADAGPCPPGICASKPTTSVSCDPGPCRFTGVVVEAPASPKPAFL